MATLPGNAVCGLEVPDHTSRLIAVDARSGREVWRSPLMRAPPQSNSINYVQLPGAPAMDITIATDNSVYLTR